MFVVFLKFTTGRAGYFTIVQLIQNSGGVAVAVVNALLFIVSLLSFGMMCWMIFDASWLNLEDEEKDAKLVTSRWFKFSPLLLMVVLMGVKTYLIVDKELLALAAVDCVLDSIVYLCAYGSLCVAHDRGFGRLFQPFAVLRSKTYIDEKGQKFDSNVIGTTMNILCLGASSWFFFIREQTVKIVKEKSGHIWLYSARSVTALLILCVLGVMFFSCVKVTFFLARNRWNYLKFSPVILAPIAVICIEAFLHEDTDKTKSQSILKISYLVVGLIAYFSLLSPPDSLFAILFQPYIAMVNLVQDIPEAAPKPHVKTNAVEPEAVTK